MLVLLAHADMPSKLLMDVLHAWHWAKAQGEARAPACSHDRVPSSSCAHIIWLLDCATRVTYMLWTTRAGVSVLWMRLWMRLYIATRGFLVVRLAMLSAKT